MEEEFGKQSQNDYKNKIKKFKKLFFRNGW